MQVAAKHRYLDTRVSMMTRRLQPQSWFQQQAIDKAIDIEKAFQSLSILNKPEGNDSDNVEVPMLDTYLAEFRILLRPIQGQARRLMMQWIRHIELRNLKALLHGALLHSPLEELRNNMLRMGDLESLPFQALLQADDIMETLRILDKTSYSSMSRQARRLFEQHNDPFFVNASIDQRYFNDLFNTISRMPEKDQPCLKKLFGFIIDRHNLVWLTRYRFTYGLKPAETWYLLTPGGYYLSSSVLYELVNLNSANHVFEQLPDALQAIIGDNHNLFAVELALEHAIEERTWDILKQGESMVSRVLSWLILREKQLLRIRGILKGRKLSLDNTVITFAMGMEQ